MKDTVEAIVAEMRKVAPSGLPPRGWVHLHGSDIRAWADRLQSAHDAEVGALRAGIVHRGDDVVVPLHLFDEINATGYEWKQRAESAESRLREAERDARRYRWLRERHDSPGDDFAVFKGVTIVDELDAAIDRAMEADNEA